MSRRLIPSSRTTRRGVRALGIAGLTGALAASLLAAAASPAAAHNLVVNPGFELDTRGWTGNAATAITRTRGGVNGGYDARVANKSTVRGTVVLNDAVNSVTKTVAGTTYDVSAYVRSSVVGTSVNLRVMEWGTSLKGQGNTPAYLRSTGWTKVSLSYRAVTSGASLDLNVLGWNVAPSRSIHVDNVTLAVRPAAPAVTPTPTPTPTPSPTATPTAPAGWNLAWADEFNDAAIDRTKWNVDNYSTFGDGNKELACLMDRPENVFEAGGALTIRARREATPLKCGTNDARFPGGREYTSAMLTTKGKADWQYGRFEYRAQLPTQANTSKGLWPAFWMRPTAGGTGEIDIMEAVGSGAGGTESNKIHQTLWYDYVGTHSKQDKTVTFPTGTPSDGYHTYAVEWEPGVIRWYVDGRLTYERNRTTTSWMDSAFSKPFYLRLNMAVGGTWPGSPDSATAFPADYKVDYVRVYKR